MANNIIDNSSNKPDTNFVAAPNYGKEKKWTKFKRKLNGIIVNKVANTPFQFRIYASYWHYILSSKKNTAKLFKPQNHYLTQKPNFGAGIGHQLANWNAGLYFAQYFKLKFAHSPFSTEKWENFLGFGQNEVKAFDLENRRDFKKVYLPRFDSQNIEEINFIGSIIASYTKSNVLFYLETDQGYMRQHDTSEILSNKFFNAPARSNNKLIFDFKNFNIALHIRRRMKIETDAVWEERGLKNQYFAHVLQQALDTIVTNKKIVVYFFSQGDISDFPEFKQFDNITYCLDMGPIDCVLHMACADLLISSKSSFSYKPALISKGIKLVPQTFWHEYPNTSDYILVDNQGNFDNNKLIESLAIKQLT